MSWDFAMPPDLPLPPQRLSTKEGWAEFVRYTQPPKPALPSTSEYARMPENERRVFDGCRRRYHDAFGPVATPAMTEFLPAIVNRAITNLAGTSGARPGAVIDGPANLGKTTLLAHTGRWYERLLRSHYEKKMVAHVGAEWHPVVYHTLTAQTTVKALNRGLANFYGAIIPKQVNAQQLTEIVVEHARKCATTLFLIDDIHYLDMRHLGAQEVNNHLKMLANETSVTFVYAGIDCEKSGLFAQGRNGGRESFGQTRGRFVHMRMEPFSIGTKAQAREWTSLVRSFEKELVLRGAREDMCVHMAPYLFKRTKGYVGALSNLLRQGANRAIETVAEEMSEQALSRIKLDRASEI